jgi:hypothetical protein
MCLSDLEFDYINPFDTAKRINKVIELEFMIHTGMTVLLLLCRVWLIFLINVPLVYLHARLYLRKQHLVDVTEIFNHLEYEKTYRLLKLGFYLVLFLVVIYRCSTSHSSQSCFRITSESKIPIVNLGEFGSNLYSLHGFVCKFSPYQILSPHSH